MLDEEKQKILIGYLEAGLTDTKIAAEMGVSRKTVYNWKEKLGKDVQEETVTLRIIMDAFDSLNRQIELRARMMDKLLENADENIETIQSLQSMARANSFATAHLIKGLGILKLKYLHEEVERLEIKLGEASFCASKLILNNQDLKAGEEEGCPEAQEMMEELFLEGESFPFFSHLYRKNEKAKNDRKRKKVLGI